MNSSPPERAASQEVAGAGPRDTKAPPELSRHVRVVNPVWNGSGFIKRKVATFYLKEGSAVLVGRVQHPDRDEMIDQLRLLEAHPKNIRAAAEAAKGYQEIERTMTLDELQHLPMMRPRIALTDRDRKSTRL